MENSELVMLRKERDEYKARAERAEQRLNALLNGTASGEDELTVMKALGATHVGWVHRGESSIRKIRGTGRGTWHYDYRPDATKSTIECVDCPDCQEWLRVSRTAPKRTDSNETL